MTTQSTTHWTSHHFAGTAEEFHETALPFNRNVWLVNVTSPTVVLGSTQRDSEVVNESVTSRGLMIAHRHSGGGAVFLHPDDSVWIDITIPRADPLWVDDVSKSMVWLGDVFVGALSAQLPNLEVYRGEYTNTPEARAVCFAGLAPGEVLQGDRKVVGISQRRTREGARFQCVLYRTWIPDTWAPVFADSRMQGAARSLKVATVEPSGEFILNQILRRLPE